MEFIYTRLCVSWVEKVGRIQCCARCFTSTVDNLLRHAFSSSSHLPLLVSYGCKEWMINPIRLSSIPRALLRLPFPTFLNVEQHAFCIILLAVLVQGRRRFAHPMGNIKLWEGGCRPESVLWWIVLFFKLAFNSDLIWVFRISIIGIEREKLTIQNLFRPETPRYR